MDELDKEVYCFISFEYYKMLNSVTQDMLNYFRVTFFVVEMIETIHAHIVPAV